MVVASPADVPPGHEPAVSDWLVRPFSAVYARTRLQAWLMRTACRWMRAPMPRDEKPRLASLRALAILDTEPEDRFELFMQLRERLNEMRAFGMPVPEDLLVLAVSLAGIGAAPDPSRASWSEAAIRFRTRLLSCPVEARRIL